MADPTCNRQVFRRNRVAFEAWIAARGAEVLVPTSEWELCRFRTAEGTSIVYHKKNGQLTWAGEAAQAYSSYLRNHTWRAKPRTERTTKSSPVCQALRQRDGDACFFCHLEVAPDDESPEHLVALTHGGPDHIANMALAHRSCNGAAGHLPLMEKIAMREKAAAAEIDEIDDLFDRSEWPPATAPTETSPPWSE